ncbi:CGNR zinc finger domain-containing protein [Streptomyces sp. NBC_01381]|uniref:CGNR zinc finger domain-containing protein n=1 Tax=Streptomyces sp. NBC_01381 TaxID=2903845 RepID=UPI00224EBCF4|nr:CGNR zinc finger domain-containing protein [Streptomyces sp. NBC_01381]MCX4672530.1 CGNR zinc finger domain-containing protein [Streptomyces sp. NBC_01381]
MLEPPASAVLVEAFANTVDVEEASDEIATPAGLSQWLTGRGLLDAHGDVPVDVPVGIPADVHASYLALRAGIREELGGHVGDTPDPALLAAADQVLAQHPVRVTARGFLTPMTELPTERRPLAALAIAWSELVTTGDAARLKRCAEHTCGWAFWDVSKNRSRRWCSMKVCGNRNKSRSYASRQRQGA